MRIGILNGYLPWISKYRYASIKMEVLTVRKLKSDIEMRKPGMEYHLRTIRINGQLRGYSGFIRNPKNNSIVYVITEKPCSDKLHYMYRYADNLSDYTGYHNRWVDSPEMLADEICKLLCVPVCEAKDIRI